MERWKYALLYFTREENDPVNEFYLLNPDNGLRQLYNLEGTELTTVLRAVAERYWQVISLSFPSKTEAVLLIGYLEGNFKIDPKYQM